MSDNLISHLTHSNSNESRNKTTISTVGRLQELFGYIERREPRGVKEILQKNEFKQNSLLHAMEKLMKNYNSSCDNTKEIITTLLSSKLDPDSALSLSSAKNHPNNTTNALTVAVQENDIKLARILIDFGCKVTDNINRNVLLVLINSNKGDISEFVYLLLNYGIDVNHCDADGNSPLILATLKELINVVKFLLENNADIDHKNIQGNTALHIAVMNGNTDLISVILKFKPEMNIVNKQGYTSLDLGAQSTRTDIYALLAEEFNRKKEESNENEQKSLEDDNSYLIVANDNKQKVNQILNANNLSTYIGHTTNKYKNAKLQKLMLLQERKQEKDKKFAINSAQNSIEVPFNFQNVDKKGKNNQLHTYIKIQSTPTLHIDISDETKQDSFIMASQIEDLKMTNLQLTKKNNGFEIDLKVKSDENNYLRSELNKLTEELMMKDKLIAQMNIEFSEKEAQYNLRNNDTEKKIEYIARENQYFLEKIDKLEAEVGEMKVKDYCGIARKEISKKDYLERKFSVAKYDEKYIIKCLQKDIVDFQEYTKEQIKRTKATQEELIRLIQESVNECMPDYEVKLYGSHATNLCLQWSDLDVVLVNKRGYSVSSYNALQGLYINLLDKTWKKSIKLIDSAVIPIIKLTSSDQYNSMHIDISLQDSKHYGLKCVDLVKSFMKEYESLEPLIFALKNILKNANLNDPYTGGLSSYGLILMVVSFLQSQQENKKSIKIAEGNLGRMFLEFLWYYGLMFDHTKYVIYAYPTTDGIADKDSINFLYNMQTAHELIIVDPLSKNNNVARSTYQFVNIKMAFMIGFVVSHEECECGCHYKSSGEECSFTSGEHCILKRIFSSVKRFNANNGSS